MLSYTKIRYYKKTARTLVNTRKIEVILIYAKKNQSAYDLPRQCLRDGEKALTLLGFLDGNVEFTPYLHLWKIGSVIKTYGNYKGYVLNIRN